MIIISDFYFPLEEIEAFCEKLAARHVTGTLVQIFDPTEATLPYAGRVKFEDSEGPETLDITQVDAIREEYTQKFAAHQKALDGMAHGLGWTFEKFSTDTNPEATLMQLYEMLTHA